MRQEGGEMTRQPGKELATRTSGTLRISLRWSPIDDRVLVLVENPETEETFELEAPRDHALDVYYHPFAYMGLPTAA
jgi:hypothetical protein